MPQERISDRYVLRDALSHGGMGNVWRGYDSVLDRPVAVKRILPGAVTTPALAEEFAKRFRREARVTARIQHPGVPQVYDAVLDASYEKLYLVMELVDGKPLSSFITPGVPFPVGWAAAVGAQIATVLSYAHEVPVIHRDLKPSNILLCRDGTVKVLDFGIAAILQTDVTKLTATGNPIGTHQYMSPEQVRGGRVTPQADLYALGCVLHELLGGRLVFEAEGEYQLMHEHVNAAPTPLRELRADVPEPLEQLVLHLLHKAPESRPADMQEVYERLLPFLPGPGDAPSADDAAPKDAPDPTTVFRRPYAPRARARAGGQVPRTPTAVDADAAPAPAVLSPELHQEIDEAYKLSDTLLDEERYAQAAEVLGEVIERAAAALGPENRRVLGMRRQRASIQLVGGDYRAVLPEFEALADAYARTGGAAGAEARDCRAQAARCRAELGQVTRALDELQHVLGIVRSTESDVSEEAVELRQNIGMMLLAQGRAAEALELMEPLHEDLAMVFGPDDEMTVEVAEVLRLIRLDLDNKPTTDD